MSVRNIAFVLIGAAVVGTVSIPTMWHALPHTMRVPFGKDVDEVLGCSLSVDADEFAQLLQNRWPLERRSASQVAPVLKVPYLADVPVTAAVHYTSPPQAWAINEPLIYSDVSRQRVAAYIRYQVVHD